MFNKIYCTTAELWAALSAWPHLFALRIFHIILLLVVNWNFLLNISKREQNRTICLIFAPLLQLTHCQGCRRSLWRCQTSWWSWQRPYTIVHCEWMQIKKQLNDKNIFPWDFMNSFKTFGPLLSLAPRPILPTKWRLLLATPLNSRHRFVFLRRLFLCRQQSKGEW